MGPEAIPDEIKAFMQIAADEEEEKFGIAKNLLAEKSEIKKLKQNKASYDAKRNEVHRQLIHNEDDKALELMKRAFIDGDYREMQSKHHKKGKYDSILCGDSNSKQEAKSLDFRSRRSEVDAKNEPEYYLSDNEEKNEYCCYDKNGLFNNVHTIRMKLTEWARMHSTLRLHDEDDEEEDAEAVKRRKKRVKRKEVIQRYDTTDGSMSNKNK